MVALVGLVWCVDLVAVLDEFRIFLSEGMEDALRAEYNVNSLKIRKSGPARRCFGHLCVRLETDAFEEIPNNKGINADFPGSD
jgi:hypothetical protein